MIVSVMLPRLPATHWTLFPPAGTVAGGVGVGVGCTGLLYVVAGGGGLGGDTGVVSRGAGAATFAGAGATGAGATVRGCTGLGATGRATGAGARFGATVRAAGVRAGGFTVGGTVAGSGRAATRGDSVARFVARGASFVGVGSGCSGRAVGVAGGGAVGVTETPVGAGADSSSPTPPIMTHTSITRAVTAPATQSHHVGSNLRGR